MTKRRLSIAERRERAWFGVRHEPRPAMSEKQRKLQLAGMWMLGLVCLALVGHTLFLWITEALNPAEHVSTRIKKGLVAVLFAYCWIARPAYYLIRQWRLKKAAGSSQRNPG